MSPVRVHVHIAADGSVRSTTQRAYSTLLTEFADEDERATAEADDVETVTDLMTLDELCQWMQGPADSDHPIDVEYGEDHEGRPWILAADYRRWSDGVIESRAVELMDLRPHAARRLARVIRAKAGI